MEGKETVGCYDFLHGTADLGPESEATVRILQDVQDLALHVGCYSFKEGRNTFAIEITLRSLQYMNDCAMHVGVHETDDPGPESEATLRISQDVRDLALHVGCPPQERRECVRHGIYSTNVARCE